jgi:quercetin dioxygenase-like cupin family protein
METLMFYKNKNEGYQQAIEGVALKTMVRGEKTEFVKFKLEAGHTLPMHAHEQEQTGYLVSGSIVLTIGDETFPVEPGDCWCIPSNVQHGAKIIKDSIAVEVFAPRRQDYLKKSDA